MQEVNDNKNTRTNYVSKDLAIIIPTKDRPKEIVRLLQSIKELDCEVGRVIVVASGQDISDVVIEFSKILPVEYYSSESGQIKQRNKGISLLNDSTKLVATIDDDMFFYKTAVLEMIKFWNSIELDTAGVGFNIVNKPSHRHTWLRGLFGVSVPEPGRVLKSGSNTSICNVKQNIRSEWLTGGATVWRQDILKNHPHREIISRWAAYEDMIFSYPIGLVHPLYICATATIKTEDVQLAKESPKLSLYRGRANFLWGIYFVQINPQLSIAQFYYKKFLEILVFLIKGLFRQEFHRFYLVMGMLSGFFLSLNYIIRKQNTIELIEAKT